MIQLVGVISHVVRFQRALSASMVTRLQESFIYTKQDFGVLKLYAMVTTTDSIK